MKDRVFSWKTTLVGVILLAAGIWKLYHEADTVGVILISFSILMLFAKDKLIDALIERLKK